MIVKACFLCKEYCVVHQNYDAQKDLQDFERSHHQHPIQTVNQTEVSDFTNIKKKNRDLEIPLISEH